MPYLALTGADEITKADSMEAAVQKWFGKEAIDEHNRLIFSGSEWNVDAFSNSWEGFSLFAEKKVLIIRHFESLSAANTAIILEIIKKDIPDNLLIIESEAWDGKTRFAKWWKDSGHPQQVSKIPYPNEMAGWLQNRARNKYRRQLGALEAHMLWDAIGDSLGELDQELKKLDMYVPAGQSIQAEHIETLLSKHRNNSIFELQKAVGLKQKGPALLILDSLMGQGEPNFLILGQVAKHLIKLAKIRIAGGKGPAALAAAAIPEFIFRKEKMEEQARAWSHEQVKRALAMLSFAEWQSKTGYIQHNFETNLIFSSIFDA